MRKSFIIAVCIALLTLVIPASAQTDPDRLVLALYFGWWTDDSWTDENISDAPLTLYDTRNPDDIERQIETAQEAGIDAFLVDWIGVTNNNVTHQSFENVLEVSSEVGFSAAAVIDLNERDFLASFDQVEESMDYLFNEAINQPGYLRIDGKPIIYFWNQERFTVSTWMSIRAQYDPNYETIWMMEGTSAAYMPTFQGMYLMSTAWSDDPEMVMEYWQDRTELYGGEYFHPTAAPGWDESEFAGWRSYSTPPRDREHGDFLRGAWSAAEEVAQDDVIIVTSWNGYYENSHVEPSINYGTETTDLLRELIIDWKNF